MFSKKTKITVSSLDDKIDKVDFMPQLAGSAYDWEDHESEGRLSIDVAHTDEELIVVATMAGTPPDEIGLHLHNDLLTIRGERRSPIPNDAEYIYEESYWGKFSRTIVLPTDVKYEFTKAEYKNGVLTIRLPKREIDSKIPILVVDD
jgi:HSP20 family protein